MTTATTAPKPTAKATRPRAAPKPFGLKLQRGSPQAERTASAILEVLAGARLPSEAAVALGCSSARYYSLESRALSGLIAACEPRPPGKQRRPEGELNALRKECDKLRRESARWQALVRLARRTTGLSPPYCLPRGARRGAHAPGCWAMLWLKATQTSLGLLSTPSPRSPSQDPGMPCRPPFRPAALIWCACSWTGYRAIWGPNWGRPCRPPSRLVASSLCACSWTEYRVPRGPSYSEGWSILRSGHGNRQF